MIGRPDLSIERALWMVSDYVAGLDEAGRGAMAGPVSVGAVILPSDDPHLARTLRRVRDSKQLTPRRRAELSPRIKEMATEWGLGFASEDEIDSLGIVPATRLAACRALECLSVIPQFLLTDFRLELPELDVPQISLVRGDQRSLSIASASILAKTARDFQMVELNSKYPEYGFRYHKGYGTRFHRRQITAFGLTPVHRRSFHFKNDCR
ncbi:MAG: ribonuclease HII [Chloroflexi bacterium]|nr:ribonuclease HII [Chloroflexota bacterium]